MNKKTIFCFLILFPLFCFSQKGILGLPAKLEQIQFGMNPKKTANFLTKSVGFEIQEGSEDITLSFFEMDGEPYEFAGFYFCENRLSNILFMRTFDDKYEALSIFFRLASIIDKTYIELPPPDMDENNPITYDGFFNGLYNGKIWEKPQSSIRFTLTLMVRMLETSNPIVNIPYTHECDYTLHICYMDTSIDKDCEK